MQSPHALKLISLMVECCRIARAVRDRLKPGDAHDKQDRSPVSVGDFAVQTWVARYLAEHGGGLPLVGEESAEVLALQTVSLRQGVVAALAEIQPDVSEADVLTWLMAMDRGPDVDSLPDYWTVDPIDGTRGYLHGGQYAIALAEIRDGQPVLGMLGCPALPYSGLPDDCGPAMREGCILYAERQGGAYMLPANGDLAGLKRITLAPPEPLKVRVSESLHSAHGHQGQLASWAKSTGRELQEIRIDSQCKYALLARGDTDVYIRKARQASYLEWVWDHAAGALIATEAGAVVTDLAGRPLDFGLGHRLRLNHGVLAARPELHAELKRYLNPP